MGHAGENSLGPESLSLCQYRRSVSALVLSFDSPSFDWLRQEISSALYVFACNSNSYH